MKTVAVSCLLIIVAVFVCCLCIHIVAYEGLNGLIFSALLKSDTKYAPKYREDSFRQIEIGFRKEEVRKLIGDPLAARVYSPDSQGYYSEYWWYSESPSGTHFHHRFLVFSQEGKVKRIGHEFYVD